MVVMQQHSAMMEITLQSVITIWQRISLDQYSKQTTATGLDDVLIDQDNNVAVSQDLTANNDCDATASNDADCNNDQAVIEISNITQLIHATGDGFAQYFTK